MNLALENANREIPTQYPVDFEKLKTMTAEEVENYFVNDLKAFENVKSLRFFIADMLYEAEQDGSWDLPVVYYEQGETPDRPATEYFNASVDSVSFDTNVAGIPVMEMVIPTSTGCDNCANCECAATEAVHQVTIDEYVATIPNTKVQ